MLYHETESQAGIVRCGPPSGTGAFVLRRTTREAGEATGLESKGRERWLVVNIKVSWSTCKHKPSAYQRGKPGRSSHTYLFTLTLST